MERLTARPPSGSAADPRARLSIARLAVAVCLRSPLDGVDADQHPVPRPPERQRAGRVSGDLQHLEPAHQVALCEGAGDRVGGDPIEASLRIADGLLRVQAIALHAAGDLDPWMLLWWNRQTRLVRFGCTRSKDLWIHADVPAAGLDARGVDRLLGLLVEGALAARGLRRPADAG